MLAQAYSMFSLYIQRLTYVLGTGIKLTLGEKHYKFPNIAHTLERAGEVLSEIESLV